MHLNDLSLERRSLCKRRRTLVSVLFYIEDILEIFLHIGVNRLYNTIFRIKYYVGSSREDSIM